MVWPLDILRRLNEAACEQHASNSPPPPPPEPVDLLVTQTQSLDLTFYFCRTKDDPGAGTVGRTPSEAIGTWVRVYKLANPDKPLTIGKIQSWGQSPVAAAMSTYQNL